MLCDIAGCPLPPPCFPACVPQFCSSGSSLVMSVLPSQFPLQILVLSGLQTFTPPVFSIIFEFLLCVSVKSLDVLAPGCNPRT